MKRSYFVSLSGIIITLIVWEALVKIYNVPNYILPAPSYVAVSLYDFRVQLIHHTRTTVTEVVFGLFISVPLALLLGILISEYRYFRQFIYPIIWATQSFPVVAISPIIILWLGYGIESKLFIVILISFFPIAINFSEGLLNVDKKYLRLMKSFSASRWQILTKVRLPHSLPFLFAGLRLSVMLAIIGAIVAEWIGSDSGLGYLISYANSRLRTDLILACLVICYMLGIIFQLTVSIVETKLIIWTKESE